MSVLLLTTPVLAPSYSQEKQERAIGLLVSLGPAPGTEATPWYLKTRSEREAREDEKEKEEKVKKEKDKGKRKTFTKEEQEKRDLKLKDSLDPLREMKKALAKKGHKEKKRQRKEKRDRGEGSSGGQRSVSCNVPRVMSFLMFLRNIK